MEMRKSAGERIFAYDALRVISIFTVVYSHLIRHLCKVAPMGSLNWATGMVLKGASIFCVPALFMISGAFLLDTSRAYPLKKLYGKNILRLATAYLFWSFGYGVLINVLHGAPLGPAFLKSVLRYTVTGRYHMWFLTVLIGIYMIVPLLRKICQSRSTQLYFLVLWAAFELIPNFLVVLFPQWEKGIFWLGTEKLKINAVLGYSGYFILGHYLTTCEVSDGTRRASYVLAVLAAVYVTYSCWTGSYAVGRTIEPPRSLLSLEIVPAGVGAFLFCRRHLSAWPKNPRVARAFARLSALSFGIYMIHDMFNLVLEYSPGLMEFLRTFTPVTLPLAALVIFAGSTLAISLLSRIPRFNRYIM